MVKTAKEPLQLVDDCRFVVEKKGDLHEVKSSHRWHSTTRLRWFAVVAMFPDALAQRSDLRLPIRSGGLGQVARLLRVAVVVVAVIVVALIIIIIVIVIVFLVGLCSKPELGGDRLIGSI
jgi:Flp pilus assembly protein TadB